MVAAPEIQVVQAVPDVPVEGDPELGVLDARVSGPVVSDEHLRRRAVLFHEPQDLVLDLPVRGERRAFIKEGADLVRRAVDPSFIDDVTALLFDLGEDIRAGARNAVAPHAELFVIVRFPERLPDQVVVLRVVVDVADRVLPVDIHHGVFLDLGQDRFVLRLCQNVFFFISFKRVKDAGRSSSFHMLHLVSLSGAIPCDPAGVICVPCGS